MNKENRPPADLDPTSDEGPVASAGGLKSSLASVEWLGTHPGYALHAPGGRFRVSFTPESGVAALKIWFSDPTADASFPNGTYYIIGSANTQSERKYTASSPKLVDLSAPTFKPPYVYYVSLEHYYRVLMHVEQYPTWDGSAPSGTPKPVAVFVLQPRVKLTASVTEEAPDGHRSSRWKRVSFGVSPTVFPKHQGIQIANASYLISSTRIRADSFEFPNGSFYRASDPKRDVWLCRHHPNNYAGGFSGLKRLPSEQWYEQAQFRRVVEAGDRSGFDSYIEYEYPFDPPLATGDIVHFITRCVMARVRESPTYFRDEGVADVVGEFKPNLGYLHLDGWRLRSPTGASTGAEPHGQTLMRRAIVDYYFHDAGLGYESGFDITAGTEQSPWDEPDVERIEIRCPPPPSIERVRALESQITAGKLRVEIERLWGDLSKWRVYAKADGGVGLEWPTLNPATQNSPPDEAYFVGEATRHQRFLETTFTLFGTVRVLVYPVASDGTMAPATSAVRLTAPEIQPILYNLRVVPDDDTGAFPVVPRHRIYWDANGAAQDALLSWQIEHTREDHRGQSHGENPTTVLYTGSPLGLSSSYLHVGTVAGATIDQRSSVAWGEFTTTTYLVTHVYTITIRDSAGTVGARYQVSITDRFSNPRDTEVVINAVHIREYLDGLVDPTTGQMVEPFAIRCHAEGKNFHFLESADNVPRVFFEYSTDGKANGDATKVWVSGAAHGMPVTHTSFNGRIELWDRRRVASGGTATPFVVRSFWRKGSDPSSTRRSLVYSNVLTLDVEAVANPF